MEQKKWSPAELLQVSGSYWSACALHAGVKLDVFTPLSAGKKTARQLAGEIPADARALELLLNALAATGLLQKEGDAYLATPFAAEFLSRDSSKYLGHILLHHHHLMESWAHLDQAVRSGRSLRGASAHGEEEWRESFLLGMFNLAMNTAPLIVPHIDLSGRRRLLDLGGGPGTYAIHFCLHNAQLRATVFDLPTTRRFAEETIARFGLSDRIDFASGDYLAGEIPGRFDVAWLSHILHGEGPEGCATILEKALGALEPGGLILVQEFILDDSMDAPLFPALFSLNMLLNTSEGQAYSQAQLHDMLAAAGAFEIRRLPLQLPNGAGVMAATVAKR